MLCLKDYLNKALEANHSNDCRILSRVSFTWTTYIHLREKACENKEHIINTQSSNYVINLWALSMLQIKYSNLRFSLKILLSKTHILILVPTASWFPFIVYVKNFCYNLIVYGVVNLKCVLRLPTHIQLEWLCFVREDDIVFEPVVAEIFSSDSVLDVSPSRSFGGGEENFVSLGSLFVVSSESELLHASIT